MKTGEMDKGLFFITLSAVCVWLIVDMAVGKNRLGSFLETLFPGITSIAGTGESNLTEEDKEELSQGKKEEAPSSSAAGSQKESNGALNTENPYGANRPDAK